MSRIHSKNPIASLSILIFGHFLNHFYAYVFGAAMFVIRNDIVMNNKQIGLLATIQMVVFALCTFIVGVLGDKWLASKKLFVPVGIFFMALHLIVASIAQRYIVLAIAAAIVGFGASFYHPVAYAAIADLYEDKKGLTMALNAALGMIGTALTPGIIASFSEWIGWRKFFLYFGLGAIVLTFLMFIGFNRLIDYSFEKEELEQIEKRRNSMTMKERIIYWLKFEFLAILTLAVITCLAYSSLRSGLYKIVTQFLSIIFVDYYDYNILNAGWLSSVMLIIGGLTAIFGGILSDKKNTPLTMFISLFGSTISILLIFLLGKNTGTWGIIILYFSFIAFLHFSSAASTKFVTEEVHQKSRSTALGFLFAIPNTLAAIFPWSFGYFMDNSPFDITLIYLFFIALVATMLTIILFARELKKKK
ncbi:MAG: MFS transporter [Candidatus Heimdallarchaeum endolithica]|uniref:MFS transporter n=1 Tax=Candidatus Heimdallarchaeum endolithica TaxID=2876572 RepID=A0A9Y1BSF9_9ARCH|nr:MAG: MFS transporter [Candidatus Heimdallarchaeum endolithica]